MPLHPNSLAPSEHQCILRVDSIGSGLGLKVDGERNRASSKVEDCCLTLAVILLISVSDRVEVVDIPGKLILGPSLTVYISHTRAHTHTVLSLFGPPQSITAFVRNQRGQLAQQVDDDFLIIAQYPPTAPLPPSEPASGTRLGGLQAVLGATCLSTHVDAEQPRFRIEGIRGSYEKRGTDPQENQLKAGWSPSSHGESFGIYKESESASIRFGRLTTSIDQGTEAKEGKAPVQPTLATSDIPTLPGRYIDYYSNVGDAIRAGEDARQGSGSIEAAQRAIDQVLVVKPQEAANCIKFLNLARQSAMQGKTVQWS